MSNPNVLLINPWIYDFAAFDLWSKPLGLLYLAGWFKYGGCNVTFIDCLDRYHPQVPYLHEKRYGCGKYYYEEVEKPQVYQDIPRKYKRYGIPVEIFKQELRSIPKPDVIFVTSLMTYWYPGVFKVIEILREYFKDIPIVLGGIYATLCYDHAYRYSNADYIVKGHGENICTKLIKEIVGYNMNIDNPEEIYPAYELLRHTKYVCILTSRGCPYRCTYCASWQLTPKFTQRDPYKVVDEIEYYVCKLNIQHIAFYDDALLVNPEKHICVILNEILKRNIKCFFHTPNGLHIRYINYDVAYLFYQTNFKTIRLSLETTNRNLQDNTGGKTSNLEFERAISNLKKAGYHPSQIEVYLMCGLPGQEEEMVFESIEYVSRFGVKIKLVEYSPIPGTKDADILPDADPLLHNNSIVPYQRLKFYQKMKDIIRKYNSISTNYNIKS
jgi:radical SAM superfamily enzyme YgiQ (UPF0313 family)